jgi:hypothetical protein
MREMPWLVRSIINLFFISVEKGAETNVMLASDPALETVTGRYFDQCKPDDYADAGNDAALRERLTNRSMKIAPSADCSGGRYQLAPYSVSALRRWIA